MACAVLLLGAMTLEKPKTDARDAELAIGVENLRRMFRQTMAANAVQTGESMASLEARLLTDPATIKLAKLLSVEPAALVHGLGKEERFIVDAAYDHAKEVERIDAIVERVAATAIGLNDTAGRDAVERAPRRMSPIAAPHVGAERGRVLAAEETARRLEAERARMRPPERAPRVSKSFADRWR